MAVLTEAELHKLERTLFDAMVSNDAPTLDRLLDDRLIYIHSAAVMQTKAEYLAWHRDRYNYKKIESSGATSYRSDGMAVVSNFTDMTMNVDGGPEKLFRLRCMYVWREQPQGWRLVLRQSSRGNELVEQERTR